MESLIEEIVHVIPMGHEIDRITKPFDGMKVNRVYLLTSFELEEEHISELFDKQQYYVEIVKETLEQKGISVVIRSVDLFNFIKVMEEVTKIITQEKADNNIVYVNISGAGRLTSVASSLAAMAHDARIYYVRADGYSTSEDEKLIHGLSICKKPRIWYLRNFKLHLPKRNELMVLNLLNSYDRGFKTNEIIEFLRDQGVEDFQVDYTKLIGEPKRKMQSSYLMKLNRGILDKLENFRYISRERVGRLNTIFITESGKYIAAISGVST